MEAVVSSSTTWTGTGLRCGESASNDFNRAMPTSDSRNFDSAATNSGRSLNAIGCIRSCGKPLLPIGGTGQVPNCRGVNTPVFMGLFVTRKYKEKRRSNFRHCAVLSAFNGSYRFTLWLLARTMVPLAKRVKRLFNATMDTRLELLESHVFCGSDEDDYRCSVCGKPRALHLHDDFPHHGPSLEPMWYAKFNCHPYFYKPGWLKNEKEEKRPNQ